MQFAKFSLYFAFVGVRLVGCVKSCVFELGRSLFNKLFLFDGDKTFAFVKGGNGEALIFFEEVEAAALLSSEIRFRGFGVFEDVDRFMS